MNKVNTIQERYVIIDGVTVRAVGLDDFTRKEAENYVAYVRGKIPNPDELKEIEVTLCGDGEVDVNYTTQGQKFERIRRITGYLTGDLNSWNNAKRAEERERVKHYA